MQPADSNYELLKFTPSGCKDIGTRKILFVAKSALLPNVFVIYQIRLDVSTSSLFPLNRYMLCVLSGVITSIHQQTLTNREHVGETSF